MPTALRPAAPPPHPHLVCGDGFYWHPKRPCVAGQTSLSVSEVQACFEGTALQRAEALSRLTAGQQLALFPEACQGCGANHHTAAANLERAWRRLQPAARGAAAELGARDLVALGAVRGATDEETAERQILAAAAVRLGRRAKENRGQS